MEPFAYKKKQSSGNRKLIGLVLAMMLAIWYFDIIPEIGSVPTGGLDANVLNPNLDDAGMSDSSEGPDTSRRLSIFRPRPLCSSLVLEIGCRYDALTGALSHPGFRVGEENGVRYQKPERPKGCFAFLVPAPLFRRMNQPCFLAVTKH